jgi:hypothetical protein
MTWTPGRSAAVSVAVVVASIAALAVFHHLTGARYVATASPVEVSRAACVRMVRAHGFGSYPATEMCARSVGHDWFEISVRNLGHRGANVHTCSVEGADRAGRTVSWKGVTPPFGFPTGPDIEPGKTLTFRWFAPGRVKVPAAVSYRAECPVVDYRGNPPI